MQELLSGQQHLAACHSLLLFSLLSNRTKTCCWRDAGGAAWPHHTTCFLIQFLFNYNTWKVAGRAVCWRVSRCMLQTATEYSNPVSGRSATISFRSGRIAGPTGNIWKWTKPSCYPKVHATCVSYCVAWRDKGWRHRTERLILLEYINLMDGSKQRNTWL